MNKHTDTQATAKAGSTSSKTMSGTSRKPRVVRVYINGWRVGVAGAPGRKHQAVVVMDSSGLSVERIDNREASKAIIDVDYPLGRALRKMKEAGKAFGCTKGAAAVLRAAAVVS